MNHKNNADKTVNFALWENIPGSRDRIYICHYDDYEMLINDVRRMIKETSKSYSIDEYCVETKYRKPFSTFVEEYDESAEEDVEEEIPAKTFTEEQRREIIETLAKKVAWSFGMLLNVERYHVFCDVLMDNLSRYYRMKTWRDRISNREELEDCMDEILDDMSSAVKSAFTQDEFYKEDAKSEIEELLHEYELDS